MSEIVDKMLSIIFSLALVGSFLVFLSPAMDRLFDEQSKLRDNERMNLYALEIITEISNFNSSIISLHNSSQMNITFRFNQNYRWKMSYCQENDSESINRSGKGSLITIFGEIYINKTNLCIMLSAEYSFNVFLLENLDANKLLILIKEDDNIVIQN